eukprot:GFYU01005878.1.p1 GENE.GFYU01005878.1~~GFYU01005878.1.p1  ORF type:complete len:106 (-),score=30.29 GFYU01005878.1:74-391(-)
MNAEECAELQEQELEVLESIFFDTFTKISDDTFQVMIKPPDEGEPTDNTLENNALLVQFSFTPNYPNEAITVSLDNFHNREIPNDTETDIMKKVTEKVTMINMVV